MRRYYENVHLTEKHSCIGRKAFDISSLSLGIDGVKCKRAFARTRKSCNYDKFVTGNFNIYIFEVMLFCTSHNNFILCHFIYPLLCQTPDTTSYIRLNIDSYTRIASHHERLCLFDINLLWTRQPLFRLRVLCRQFPAQLLRVLYMCRSLRQ